ncbi:MAG: OsmC family protein [Thermoplasmata archaeon]|jgi:organic hydroperoxide reductase OsmC/OhrA
MAPIHTYRTTVRWTGDLGTGTREYRGYSRDHAIEVPGKPPILATSSLAPRSDPLRYNPDELLVAALSSCHMLWYLHLCSEAGVVVTAYIDEAEGILETGPDGGGHFTRVTLRPRVVVSEGSLAIARDLHEAAHRKCFVASSVNFPVLCEPDVGAEPAHLK